MTESELAAIRARLAASTPGPWVWREAYDGAGYHELASPRPGETHPDGSPVFVRVHSDGSAAGEYGADINVNGPDAALIANAPADLAALLAEVDILRGLLGDRVQDSDLALEAARRERARCVGLLRLRESANRRMAQAAREAGHVSGIRPATVESLEDEADALAEAVTLLLGDAP